MDFNKQDPAATMIWDHDNDVLQTALDFYNTLESQLAEHGQADLDYIEISEIINGPAPEGFDADIWLQVQASHEGFQAGCDILSLLPYTAFITQFHELNVNEDLSVFIPEKLLDETLQVKMAKILVPPPVAKSDEILAASGGMFYSCEAPGMPPFVEQGTHFNAGEPLYIVEVMKMFNKVNAPFSGTVDKILVEDDGAIISKGQVLFKITPDEIAVVESPEVIKSRIEKQTSEFLNSITLLTASK